VPDIHIMVDAQLLLPVLPVQTSELLISEEDRTRVRSAHSFIKGL
jgi:hypothetical protein